MAHRSPLAQVPLISSMSQNGGQWISPPAVDESALHHVAKTKQHPPQHPIVHHQRRHPQHPKQIFGTSVSSSLASHSASLPAASSSPSSPPSQVHQLNAQHAGNSPNPVQPVINGGHSGQASQANYATHQLSSSSPSSSPPVSVINSQAFFTQYLQDQLANPSSDRPQLSQSVPTKEDHSVYTGQHSGFKSGEVSSSAINHGKSKYISLAAKAGEEEKLH